MNTNTKKVIWKITPEKAQALLETNPNNRRIRPVKVAQYAKDMTNGNWKIDGHEISLAKDGKLLDGQHRMMAVIASDSTLDFWMALNVPETTQFDIGAPRSSADSVRIGKMLNNPYLASNRAISLVNAFFRVMYGSAKASQMTNYDRANFLNENEEGILFILGIIGSHGAMMNRGAASASLLAADMCGVNRNDLSSFAQEVNTGVICDANHSSAAVLRTMLMESKFGGGGSQRQEFIASATCQAISDYINGRGRRKKYQNGKTPYFEELRRREGIE